MTKEDAAKFLPFVQALAEGKTIQARNQNGRWYDLTDPEFIARPDLHRIKPEAAEFWVVLRPSGRPDLHTSRDSAAVNSFEGCRIVHVREVEE